SVQHVYILRLLAASQERVDPALQWNSFSVHSSREVITCSCRENSKPSVRINAPGGGIKIFGRFKKTFRRLAACPVATDYCNRAYAFPKRSSGLLGCIAFSIRCVNLVIEVRFLEFLFTNRLGFAGFWSNVVDNDQCLHEMVDNAFIVRRRFSPISAGDAKDKGSKNHQ